jgi:hypothetical protein
MRQLQSKILITRNEVSKKTDVKEELYMDLLVKTTLKYIPKNNTVDTVLITANESINFVLELCINDNISKWKHLTKANLQIHNVTAKHEAMTLIPHVKDVSNILNQTILKEI